MNRYYYETPMWSVTALCSVAVLLAFLCFAAFHYWAGWAGGAPTVIRWLLLLMGLVFLTAGIRPRHWRPWRYFYADEDGPSECPETKDTKWLMVPWARIGSIKRRTFYGRYKGPSIELLLKDDEIDPFFTADKLTKRFSGRPALENGFFTVGYSNDFINIDHAVRTLNQMKGKHT